MRSASRPRRPTRCSPAISSWRDRRKRSPRSGRAKSKVFVNLHETYPGDFTRSADFSLPTRRLRHAIEERAGAGHVHFVEADRLASALVGDAIATNMLMVGFAWQQGGLPISRASILEAIRLNGVEVEMNIAAFEWGRRAAFDLAAAERAAGIAAEARGAIAARRSWRGASAFLTDYQNAAYAARYEARSRADRGGGGSRGAGQHRRLRPRSRTRCSS